MLFRPGGDGAEGQQVVENQGLTLECPETITVSTGTTIMLQCEVNNNSRYRQGTHIHPSIYTNWDDFYNYVVLNNGSDGEIGLNKHLIMGTVWIRRDDRIPVGVVLISGFNPGEVVLSVRSYVRVQVKHPLFFYTGLGLLLLQIIVLISSPVLGILLRIYRTRTSQAGNKLAIFSVNEYRAADMLWKTYIAQALLMLAFHIWDFQIYASGLLDPIFPPQSIYILTIPVALGFVALLFGVWRYTMKSIGVPSIWAESGSQDDELGQVVVKQSWIPFVGVVVIGCLLLPVAFWLYFVVSG